VRSLLTVVFSAHFHFLSVYLCQSWTHESKSFPTTPSGNVVALATYIAKKYGQIN
jgi:hypothetical protein